MCAGTDTTSSHVGSLAHTSYSDPATTTSVSMSSNFTAPTPRNVTAIEIDASEISICMREDGSPWLLGQGNFGQVGHMRLGRAA